MFPRRVRAPLGVVAVMVTSILSLGSARDALAFDAKHTPNGTPVHWSATDIDFALSPTLDAAAPHARAAIARALSNWGGAGGAPSLRTHAGDGSEHAAYDGQNVIFYAKDGYPAAGAALAITALTYEDTTGRIVDCDIVLNGEYKFAVLDDSDKADDEDSPISTEGGGTVHGHKPFDLIHVFAHEAGHALGLNDEPHQAAALMYPFSRPGDPSMRDPEPDDVAGVTTLYAAHASSASNSGSAASDASSGSSGSGNGAAGCAMSPSSQAGSASFLLAAAVIALPLIRRRRAVRGVMIASGLFLTFAALPAGATTAPAFARSHALAEITATSTVVRDGLFTTDLTLATRECHRDACPSESHVTVLGGHVAGLTQEIGGVAIPEVGQRIAVDFDAADETRSNLARE
jgi:MYXO-CTERM domain-containing protein